MKPLVVMGSSGHASVILNAAILQGKFKPVGMLSAEDPNGASIMGVPVLGRDDKLKELADAYPGLHAIIAIGDNHVRYRLAQSMEKNHPGLPFATIVHPSAIIDQSVTIGSGSYVAPGAILNHGARVGAHAIVNSGAVIEHHVQVGDFAFVGSNAALAGHVHVGHSAMIGTAATIIPDKKIEKFCVVGAGAVVINDVSTGTTVVGVPARPKG